MSEETVPVPPDQRKECPTCHGNGEIDDDTGSFKFKVCSECSGQGWVKKE